MKIIPAIDIKNGHCVRLQQGDPNRETVYNHDPVEQAREFERAGVDLIHVVDLDGAFKGEPVNLELVARIQEEVSCTIEVGGGIRSDMHIRLYRDAGLQRIILGSVILSDAFAAIARDHGEVLVAGIDARDGHVSTSGWLETSTVRDEDLIATVREQGISEVIYTDISTDGMLSGPSYDELARLLRAFPEVSFTASGGVSSLEDIEKLSAMGHENLTGCIVGKAIYDGRVNLGDALSLVQ